MRVVMFVYNDVSHDSRVLREAGSLAAEGHEVTIFGRPRDLAAQDIERESAGAIRIVRVPLPDRWQVAWTFLRSPWRMGSWIGKRIRRGLVRSHPNPADLATGLVVAAAAIVWSVVRLPFHVLSKAWREARAGSTSGARTRAAAGVAGGPARPQGSLLSWFVRWRMATLGWAYRAARLAPAADIYHGHDLSGLPGAVEAVRLNGGRAIYDSHEVFVEAGSNAARPAWARSILARFERRLSARTVALITVNDAIAEELTARLHPRRTVVVYNCSPRWSPPSPRPDRLRTALGIPVESPIALYHGGLVPTRGLEQIAAAMLMPELAGIHAVFLGYGSMWEHLVALAGDERYQGRLHVLPAVLPDELPAWIASADVGVMPLQHANTLNHRFSTPNKLFECLAAGTPVVVSDLPEMRRIVLQSSSAGPLGEICDPGDPADIARAVHRIVRLSPGDAEVLRARCLAAAHERWNWETEAAKLVALYDDLECQGRS